MRVCVSVCVCVLACVFEYVCLCGSMGACVCMFFVCVRFLFVLLLLFFFVVVFFGGRTVRYCILSILICLIGRCDTK